MRPLAFAHISRALQAFAGAAGIPVTAIVPISALKGWNVVDAAAQPRWCGYSGPTLLALLEKLPATPAETDLPFAFPVQWVEKFSSFGRHLARADACSGAGWPPAACSPAHPVQVFPSGQIATVAQVLDHARRPKDIAAGHSAGIVLDREVDVSRGDWILAAPVETPVTADEFDAPAPRPAWPASRELSTTVAWMDDEPWSPGACTGRCMATAGSRPRSGASCTVWTSTRWKRTTPRSSNPMPSATWNWCCRSRCRQRPYTRSRLLGALILVDTASHKTSGAALVN